MYSANETLRAFSADKEEREKDAASSLAGETKAVTGSEPAVENETTSEDETGGGDDTPD